MNIYYLFSTLRHQKCAVYTPRWLENFSEDFVELIDEFLQIAETIFYE